MSRRRRKNRGAAAARAGRTDPSLRGGSVPEALSPFLSPLVVAVPAGYHVHLLLPGTLLQSSWFLRRSSTSSYGNPNAPGIWNESPSTINSGGSPIQIPTFGGGIVGKLL
jgi:hypothetical protein